MGYMYSSTMHTSFPTCRAGVPDMGTSLLCILLECPHSLAGTILGIRRIQCCGDLLCCPMAFCIPSKSVWTGADKDSYIFDWTYSPHIIFSPSASVLSLRCLVGAADLRKHASLPLNRQRCRCERSYFCSFPRNNVKSWDSWTFFTDMKVHNNQFTSDI